MTTTFTAIGAAFVAAPALGVSAAPASAATSNHDDELRASVSALLAGVVAGCGLGTTGAKYQGRQ